MTGNIEKFQRKVLDFRSQRAQRNSSQAIDIAINTENGDVKAITNNQKFYYFILFLSLELRHSESKLQDFSMTARRELEE